MQNQFEQHTGAELVDYCTRAMEVSPTMLASLIGVTERTLSSWSETRLDGCLSANFARLIVLAGTVRVCEEKGVKGRVILSLLCEQVPEDKEQRTLMYYVVDKPADTLLSTVAVKAVDSFSGT